jgi:D-tagatose-1,6-bisphosphate aldolase subunit GatZ/KbaZ
MEENRDLGGEITRLTFVVGTEVPTPGGSMTDESKIQVSKVEETKENISITEEAFKRNHLEDVWKRVLAFVVQPGVEFSDTYVHPYNRDNARELSRFIENYENLIYEAHSTDYQSRSNLKKMVADHFAILKVGPALTFALREALFSLEEIEREVTCKESIAPSNLKHVLDETMLSNPQSWIKYYSKDPEKQSFQRRYSLLDRSRYYLNTPSVDKSIKLLISNLSATEIPLSLVSQYFPDQIDKITDGKIKSDPHDLINERIGDVINNYIFACSKGEPVFEAEGIY